MKRYTTPVSRGNAVHDPDGPDVQVHEDENGAVMTVSDRLINELGWNEGDDVIWEVGEKGISVSNPQAEVRRKLREKVDELLRGGPEL